MNMEILNGRTRRKHRNNRKGEINMADAVMNEAKEKMKKQHKALQRQLGQIRAGRANASLLDRIMVDYYGVPTPVNQMASITIPEARVLMVTPFDKNMIKDVEKAI
jgi:ribosome recycling factor